MSQDIGPGGALVGAGWSLQADEALKAFEAQLDAPAQAIEGEDVHGGESIWRQRGDENDPVGGSECGSGYAMTAFASRKASLASGFGRRRGRLLESDETQSQCGAGQACDVDRLIDDPGTRVSE